MISFGHVVHQLNAHAKASVLHFAIIMLARPHTRVDDKFKLASIKFKKSSEAEEIDCFKQFEEFDAVLRILREVFIDHFECAFKDVLHDGGYLVRHEALLGISIVLAVIRRTVLTEYFDV